MQRQEAFTAGVRDGTSLTRAGSFSGWFELDLRLQLFDTEERRRPTWRAFRDPERPEVWDRQLVIPHAPPRAVAAELAELDEFYRAIAAPQWSIWCPEGALSEVWEAALEPHCVVYERMLLMAKETRPGRLPPGVLHVDGPDRFERLLSLRCELAPGTPSEPVIGQLVDLMRKREAHGLEPRILAYLDDGELISWMHLTVCDGVAWMEDLETRFDRRGRGAARALLAAADVVAHEAGANVTGYYTEASDWPWHWYSRLGFRVIGACVRFRRSM